MLDANSLSKYEVLGERKDDDLPCAECGEYGPVLIITIRLGNVSATFAPSAQRKMVLSGEDLARVQKKKTPEARQPSPM
jgi:hypothetical protein